MAWDSKAGLASRRRQNSTASRTSASGSTTSASPSAAGTSIQPRSVHVADPFLQDFLQPGFDPAAYWNATLGSGTGTGAGRGNLPATSAGAAGRLAAAATSLTATADRAAQAQAALSQLGAHTSRLASVLTQLTDEILRSGSRLAYEVELLRGETIGLGEVVVQHQAALQGDAAVRGALGEPRETPDADADAEREADNQRADDEQDPDAVSSSSSSEPPALAQLRMLAQVRSRLDAVIRTFGDAMEFVMPPSALSVTASFLSVSGPDQGGGSGAAAYSGQQDSSNNSNNGSNMEDKGQQVLRARREEIAKLLERANTTNGNAEAAAARVDALRTLCRVWTGTAEEKARVRFVEGLQRMVEERQRELDRERERLEWLERQQKEKLQRDAGHSDDTATPPAPVAGQGSQDGPNTSGSASKGYAAAGYGFISQLQKIRSGL